MTNLERALAELDVLLSPAVDISGEADSRLQVVYALLQDPDGEYPEPQAEDEDEDEQESEPEERVDYLHEPDFDPSDPDVDFLG